MSMKRYNPMPTASLSDEDEVESSIREGEGNSASEEEQDDDVSSINPTVPSTENQDSDSETEPEEVTDSDSEIFKSQVPNLKPSVVKSAIETKDSVKAKPLTKSAAKRSSEGGGSMDAKRVKREDKKKNGGEETEPKKTYFQRKWSEEDEIVVLQGAIDYKTDIGVSPYDDMNGFYQLMKISIGFDVSKIQFKEKLRALKKKYENNLGKIKNGEKPKLPKPHDTKTFELSKSVWGDIETSNEKSNKSLKSAAKREPKGLNFEEEEEVTLLCNATELDTAFVKSLERFGVDDITAQQGWSRLSSEDKKSFEEQWKAIQRRKLEFSSQKTGFIHEVVTKMAQAFGSKL